MLILASRYAPAFISVKWRSAPTVVSAASAFTLAPAMALSQELAGLGIPIRTGLHTGECERVGPGVRGLAVHIGARVVALGQSGEVLVSNTVREAVAGSSFKFADRGTHTLKGVPGEWRLFALEG